jgi:hypothetical protein
MPSTMPRILIWLAACVLVLSGCAANPEVRRVTDDNGALIFGYFDMSEAPFPLGCVRITQAERAGIAYRQSCMSTLKSGAFFLESVPPMKYHVPFFYAGGKLHMISSDQKDAFDVAPGSLHYLGSFKYRVVTRDLGQVLQLKPEQYGLGRVKSPDERAVLRMLLESVQDERTKQRIRARLAQR